ncbi:hypothetical protein J7M28_14055 [bacterium]|nr:hypothetical protein [bacterium]
MEKTYDDAAGQQDCIWSGWEGAWLYSGGVQDTIGSVPFTWKEGFAWAWGVLDGIDNRDGSCGSLSYGGTDWATDKTSCWDTDLFYDSPQGGGMMP